MAEVTVNVTQLVVPTGSVLVWVTPPGTTADQVEAAIPSLAALAHEAGLAVSVLLGGSLTVVSAEA